MLTVFNGEKRPASWRERAVVVLRWVALTSVFWIIALAYAMWALLGFPVPRH